MGLSDHLLVRPLPPFKHTLAPNNVSSRVAANIRRLNLKVGDVPAAEGKTGCNALPSLLFPLFPEPLRWCCFDRANTSFLGNTHY
jgi:hypothetical protein